MPRNLRLRLSLGEVLHRARRPKEALAESEAVLAVDAPNRFALRPRARRDLKEFDKARDVADQALSQDKNDLKAAYLKVTIAEARRDFTAAVATLEQVLARDRKGEDAEESGNNDRVFLLHLGFSYQQLGRFADAADAFAKAKAVGGEADAELYGHEIDALILAKEYDRGLAQVRDARKTFPNDADLATQEATLLRLKGDLAGATAIVEKLRKKTPPDAAVLAEVADFYQRAKLYRDSESTLRDARKVNPKDVRILFQLGASPRAPEAPTTPRPCSARPWPLQPESAPILNYLGYMNADRGVKVDEAMKLIERAVNLDLENGAYLDSLGWAHYRLDQVERAERACGAPWPRRQQRGRLRPPRRHPEAAGERPGGDRLLAQGPRRRRRRRGARPPAGGAQDPRRAGEPERQRAGEAAVGCAEIALRSLAWLHCWCRWRAPPLRFRLRPTSPRGPVTPLPTAPACAFP
jgi:tetratricopeptide (TPR) repeat protein